MGTVVVVVVVRAECGACWVGSAHGVQRPSYFTYPQS